MTPEPKPILLIACGAIGREILEIIKLNGWDGFEVACLPAELHNTPEKIPDRMRQKIGEAKASGGYQHIVAAYGDCGTGGRLDDVLREEGVERIPGAHCYEFYTGPDAFADMIELEIGTFYATDFLIRFFDRLVIGGLGLDRHPELRDVYFGKYKKLTYLAQTDDPELVEKGRAAAEKLGLAYDVRHTGYGGLETFLAKNRGGARVSALKVPVDDGVHADGEAI